MSVVGNRVKRGFYADSVALMRISRELGSMKGVLGASLMIGTPSNKALLAEALLIGEEGRTAQPDDLVIAVRATRAADAARALDAAEERLAAGGQAVAMPTGVASARGLDAALALRPDANVALISVPGEFAAAQARRALERGLHVMMFSDNVAVADEIALKQLARSRGLLLMGPDCGTCHIGGAPLAFANVVPRGNIGLVSASGTGLQEVMCLIARGGHGISHAIGVGGRDLSREVGGSMTLAAFDALDRDPGTQTIVMISKPPAGEVAAKVYARVAKSRKRVVLCLLGADRVKAPGNVVSTGTLLAAARAAIGSRALPRPPKTSRRKGWLRGLFCGGTLCAEAQLVLQAKGFALQSNAPVPGVHELHESHEARGAAHTLIDLGDGAFTRGRPHPMIDPELRNEQLAQALRDSAVAVVLLDVVIGHGAHADPAGLVADVMARVTRRHALVIASVTGTEADPQGYARQVSALRTAGVIVANSNAEAALAAAGAISASPNAPRKTRAGRATGSERIAVRRVAPAGRRAASRRGKP